MKRGIAEACHGRRDRIAKASLHLHHSLGFVVTAQMPQVGTKFGRWLDLTFMQLQLDERTEPNAIG